MSNETIFCEEIYPKKKGELIKRFQYRGGDNSYLYKYLFSPLSEFILEKCIPETLAQINKTKFTIPLTLYLLIKYRFRVDEVLPSWINFVCAAFIFIYIILDNIDGKQARKTKNGTPVGLLFDHGCDSIVAPILSIIVLQIFCLTGIEFIPILMIISFVFLIATYEEQYKKIYNWVKHSFSHQSS